MVRYRLTHPTGVTAVVEMNVGDVFGIETPGGGVWGIVRGMVKSKYK